MGEFSHQLAADATTSHIKLDAAQRIAAGFTVGAQHLQLVDTPLCLGAPGFHAPANPDFFLRQQLVGTSVDDGLLGGLLFFLHQVGGKVAGVTEQPAPVEFNNTGGHVVQKRAVMCHGDDAALEVTQQAFQPLNAVQIQVVGGLVQQQHVGCGHQRLGQGHALFVATREGADQCLRLQVQAVHGLIDTLLPVPSVQSLNFALHRVQVAVALGIFVN